MGGAGRDGSGETEGRRGGQEAEREAMEWQTIGHPGRLCGRTVEKWAFTRLKLRLGLACRAQGRL